MRILLLLVLVLTQTHTLHNRLQFDQAQLITFSFTHKQDTTKPYTHSHTLPKLHFRRERTSIVNETHPLSKMRLCIIFSKKIQKVAHGVPYTFYVGWTISKIMGAIHAHMKRIFQYLRKNFNIPTPLLKISFSPRHSSFNISSVWLFNFQGSCFNFTLNILCVLYYLYFIYFPKSWVRFNWICFMRREGWKVNLHYSCVLHC